MGFKIGKVSLQNVTPYANDLIIFDDESSANGYYDNNGNWASNSYTAPYAGLYTLMVQSVIQTSVLPSSPNVIRIYVNGVSTLFFTRFEPDTLGVDVLLILFLLLI